MATVNPASSASIYEQYKPSDASKEKQPKGEIGQAAFFKLMTAQLQNQDPFSPMENGQFLSQVAQFGTVDGINKLQGSFEGLSTSLQSNKALQASVMVGREVLVPGDNLELANGSLQGAVNLPASVGNLRLSFYDDSGQLVAQQDMGEQKAGIVRFDWDGSRLDGEFGFDGRYRVKAEALVDGKTQAFEIMGKEKVESVSVNNASADLTLNLANKQSVSLSKVVQIS